MVWWADGKPRNSFIMIFLFLSQFNISGCLYSILKLHINIKYFPIQFCKNAIKEKKILVLISQNLHLLQILANNLFLIVISAGSNRVTFLFDSYIFQIPGDYPC